jgi:20S proteasome alpha/beta subunit
MTIAIGLYCSDGLVIATDSAITVATHDGATTEMKAPKIFHLMNDVIFAYSGNFSMAERIRRRLASFLPGWLEESATADDLGDRICTEFEKMFSKYVIDPMKGVDCTIMLGIIFNETPELILFSGGFKPQFYSRDYFYVAHGSGKQFADPFMSFLQNTCDIKTLKVEHARLLSYWIIDHVIEANTGGVRGPVQLQCFLKRDDDTGHDHLSVDGTDEYENKIRVINERISQIVFGQDEVAVESDLPYRRSIDGRR